MAAYHITHVGNLLSIATCGELRCDSSCGPSGVTPVSIAYQDLKAKRTRWPVEHARQGTLADYVPFYLAPRSPMLYVIHRGGVGGYSGGQAEVVHMVFSITDIARPEAFVLTNGHAAMALTNQYDDLARLDQVDWSVLHGKYWHDTDQDGDRARRRQAELLVAGAVPFSAVRQIGVMTETVAEEVVHRLADAGHSPPVIVREDWYYQFMPSNLELVRGNLLEADAEALVNTVNTVGVMGKGIALQFKKAYPSVFDEYRRACDAGQVVPGTMQVLQTGQVSGPRLIINFPTKRHWRGKSRLTDIEVGLQDLVRVLAEWEIKSVAVPPLGCGNGGLEWGIVRPRIEAALGGLQDTHVLLYEPAGAPPPREQPVATSRPRMTVGRAALIAVLDGYRKDPAARITLLVCQKLVYLLQVRGEPLNLEFEKGRFGPYSETLNHVLQRMEGHFLHGYGDRTEEADIRIDADAEREAASCLDEAPVTRARIVDVRALINGFESPWGLELLSTVYWAAHHGGVASPDEAARFVADWNPRKQRVFDAHHVEVAWDQLASLNWLPEPLAR